MLPIKPVTKERLGKIDYYCTCGRYLGFTRPEAGVRELRKEEICRDCGMKIDWEAAGITNIHINNSVYKYYTPKA